MTSPFDGKNFRSLWSEISGNRDFIMHCVKAMDQHWRALKAEQNKQTQTRIFRK